MKKTLLAIALTLGFSAAVMATDLSSVGTTSTEATVDYSYLRSIDTPNYSAVHNAEAGVQVNAGGLGSFIVEAGDTQRVTDYRLNFPTFTVGYANGVKVGNILGGVGLVGEVQYSTLTGDRWFLSGRNSAIPSHTVAGTAEINLPVGFVVTHWLINVRPFVDYTVTHTYDRYENDVNDAIVAAGIYAVPTTFAPHLVTKIGYERTTENGLAQGLVASLSYKF
jgi:hypothetical protein